MGSFTVGDIVLLPFPYANLTVFKKRPALVVGLADFNNLILCQITSKNNGSVRAVQIQDTDFSVGKLSLNSFVRPDKLFTVELSIIENKLGTLRDDKLELVHTQIRKLFT